MSSRQLAIFAPEREAFAKAALAVEADAAVSRMSHLSPFPPVCYTIIVVGTTTTTTAAAAATARYASMV